ncbi:hypothetical protein BCU74_03845 [Vibrio breoganii]|uniref:replication initiation protein n=1 Tax=Vibrio breoganii TaxID=553239 RepID=UPI000C86370F|nr:replication initiation protein [Vibrio breoganii]PMH12417.1 hypothetical protein BCU74_03845 [Vibrio breoganii]
MKLNLQDGEVQYDLALIEPPLDNKMLKLKNEFMYANYHLEVQEQRLMYTAMSSFDCTSFLQDANVLKELNEPDPITGALSKPDFAKITPALLNKVFWCPELRSVVLPVYDLLLSAGTQNYNALDDAVSQLQKRMFTIDWTNDDRARVRRSISPIELIERVENADGKKEIVITFTQSFMQYIVAFSGYRKIDLEILRGLRGIYTSRYYEWFCFKLQNNKKVTFEMSVAEIKKRFEIPDDAYKKQFFQRVVQKAQEEITEKTDLDVSVSRVVDTKKRGRPLKAVRFFVARKTTKMTRA